MLLLPGHVISPLSVLGDAMTFASACVSFGSVSVGPVEVVAVPSAYFALKLAPVN